MKNDIVVGMVGRQIPLKNHENFVKLANLILKDNKFNFKFFIIGNGISARSLNLDKYFSKKEIQKNFILRPETLDLNKYYQIMDFCLSLSFTEGFPNVIAESMLNKVIVIGTNVGDTKNILLDYNYLLNKNYSIHSIKKKFIIL